VPGAEVGPDRVQIGHKRDAGLASLMLSSIDIIRGTPDRHLNRGESDVYPHHWAKI